MKTHFAQRLITELINNEIIREGITIPYLVRAYKINNGDDSLISEEYIKYVFNHIVEDNDNILYIKQCTQVGNHRTISIATSDEIEEFNSDIRYKSLKNNDGNSIIYFEINFECSEVSIENICKLFWNQYKDLCFIPQRYSYEYSAWRDISPKEIDIIKSI